jgi:hypothetical protein
MNHRDTRRGGQAATQRENSEEARKLGTIVSQLPAFLDSLEFYLSSLCLCASMVRESDHGC